MNTRKHILKSALLLFLEKGFKNVSYQDLVKKTKLSKGAIYHYFVSKDMLLVSVFELFSQRSDQGVGVSFDNLFKDVDAFKTFYIGLRKQQLKDFKAFVGAEIAKFNWVLFCLEAVEANEDLRETIKAMSNRDIKFFESCFVSLKNNGALPKERDPIVLAKNLYYLIEGEGLIMFLQGNELDDDYIDRLDKTLDDFFNMIN